MIFAITTDKQVVCLKVSKGLTNLSSSFCANNTLNNLALSIELVI